MHLLNTLTSKRVAGKDLKVRTRERERSPALLFSRYCGGFSFLLDFLKFPSFYVSFFIQNVWKILSTLSY